MSLRSKNGLLTRLSLRSVKEVLLARLENTSPSSKNGLALGSTEPRQVAFGLPTCFLNTRDLSFVCQFTEADTADSIFSQIRMRTSADCGRPQILQRLYSLVENFGLRCCLIFIDVFAMNFPPYFANGILNCVNNSRASSSVLAVVTKITSIPLTLSILSYSISGKISCSLIPSA